MSPYKKPGDDWRGPSFDEPASIEVLHEHVLAHAMVVNTATLAEIAKKQPGYRRTVRDYHIFGPTDNVGEFAIRLPVVTWGSGGKSFDWKAAVCWTGPVNPNQITAMLILLNRAIENHHRDADAKLLVS